MEVLPSRSRTPAMSVPSLIVTPLFRSFSATFTSSSPEIGFPNRGRPGLTQITCCPSFRSARAASRPRYPGPNTTDTSERSARALIRSASPRELSDRKAPKLPIRPRGRIGFPPGAMQTKVKVGPQGGGGELLGDYYDFGVLLHFPGGLRGRDPGRPASENQVAHEESPPWVNLRRERYIVMRGAGKGKPKFTWAGTLRGHSYFESYAEECPRLVRGTPRCDPGPRAEDAAVRSVLATGCALGGAGRRRRAEGDRPP